MACANGRLYGAVLNLRKALIQLDDLHTAHFSPAERGAEVLAVPNILFLSHFVHHRDDVRVCSPGKD
eukprot:scaffold43380_cov66-Phaeocystis_antarctica.AAC.5